MAKEDLIYSVSAAFAILKANLNISVAEKLLITQRKTELEKVLVKQLGSITTVLAGACERDTMIAPLGDNIVDLFVLFGPTYIRDHTPDVLLEKLHSSLLENYSGTAIDPNNHRVTVKASDFSFNIIPACFQSGKGYIVPDIKGERWIKSDPALFHVLLEDDNQLHKGYLIPVIKMIKCWNRSINGIFDEYYLEILIRDILSRINIPSYASAIRYIFKQGTAGVAYTVIDPSGFDSKIEGLRYMDKVIEAMTHFSKAYQCATNAGKYEEQGQLVLAYKEWEKVFPGHFPTPLNVVIQQLEAKGIKGAEALSIINKLNLN